jgi:hypothetical protein
MDYYSISGELDRCFGTEYDHCIIGFCIETQQPIYSVEKIARVVMKKAKITYFEALDFVINTMKGCRNGSCEPILCMDAND